MYKSQKVAIILTVIYLIISVVVIVTLGDMSTKFALGSSTLFGVAVIIYRLFRGSSTRVVKYTHMIIHMVAIGLLIEAALLNKSEDQETITQYVMIFLVVAQFLIAIFIFIYLYDYPRLRLYFAPFHDIIGIWLYICVVLTALHGTFGAFQEITFSTILGCFGFIIIIIIVLSPFFEWELVGYI